MYWADSIGIVCPVFGHGMLELVKEFLKGSQFETDYFYILLTYGNRHSGVAELAKEYAYGLGVHPAYVNVVLMVDNFLLGFDMEVQNRIDKKVDQQLSWIKADLAEKSTGSPPLPNRTGWGTHRIYSAISMRSPTIVLAAGSVRRCSLKNVSTWRGRRVFGTEKATSPAWPVIHSCPMLAIQLRLPEKIQRHDTAMKTSVLVKS